MTGAVAGLAILLVAACSTARVPTLTSEQVLAAENARRQAVLDRDVYQLDRLTASEFTRETAEWEAAAFPHGRTAEVPDAGHVVHLANPQGFLDAVLKFIGRD